MSPGLEQSAYAKDEVERSLETRRRMPPAGYALLKCTAPSAHLHSSLTQSRPWRRADFYTHVGHNPDSAARESLLAAVRKLPGCEWYEMKLLCNWFSRRRVRANPARAVAGAGQGPPAHIVFYAHPV
ncbi:hypothetical protein CERSUDRAFT_97602 [Gelatoporia subvermispora B]|uniref:Uncharacterized protein n=1 Tax=Ceriporiopsis subvermispora (strain B) TaxID=914234 RepID=M2R7F9_CERS8|nr:hypothetical protein CERSUDRAFT_97602 [Gelatoporia subvermispora B]